MSGEGLKLLSKIGLNKQNTNLRLKHSDRETGRNVDHLYGNSGGENFPANDTDIGFLPFTKIFLEVPLESKWYTLFGKFLGGKSHKVVLFFRMECSKQ